MTGLRLVRLTVVGSDVPDAAVDFGPGLTVIYGSSNTGKSYVVEALDFMLGGKSLKSIPESEPYELVMLSMTLPDGSPLTLVRKIGGGGFSAYAAHLTTRPNAVADFALSPTRDAKGGRISLSSYLLQAVGLGDKELRKNARNVTVPLSFRNLCLLCIIDETKVQSKVAPATSGQWVTKTAELSLLKLLLQGEDDSKFAQEAGAAEKRKVSRGKADILEQAINDLLGTVEGDEGVIELSERLSRVNRSIEEHTDSVDRVLEARASVLADQSAVLGRSRSYQLRLDEVNELLSRFALLRVTYSSDLARLEMVQEAGTLLGYFRPGVCVFCGAEVEHQAADVHSAEEITAFGQSIVAEIEKTVGLKEDLDITISDLESQRVRLLQALEDFASEADRFRSRVEELDSSLHPERLAIQELLSVRSAIEGKLAAYNQIEKLRELKASVEPEEEEAPPPTPGLNERIVDEFSEVIKGVLQDWSVPGAESVRYSKTADDVLVGDQPRSSHGKGMRAILHSAFTVGLAQYCFDRELEHPGFIVLDSPLLPYREPEPGVAEAPSPEEFKGVADSFFAYLDSEFHGQSVVVENVDPPTGLSEDAEIIRFTGNLQAGRYGFFPPRATQR